MCLPCRTMVWARSSAPPPPPRGPPLAGSRRTRGRRCWPSHTAPCSEHLQMPSCRGPLSPHRSLCPPPETAGHQAPVARLGWNSEPVTVLCWRTGGSSTPWRMVFHDRLRRSYKCIDGGPRGSRPVLRALRHSVPWTSCRWHFRKDSRHWRPPTTSRILPVRWPRQARLLQGQSAGRGGTRARRHSPRGQADAAPVAGLVRETCHWGHDSVQLPQLACCAVLGLCCAWVGVVQKNNGSDHVIVLGR